jgi:hypothetical protein
MFSAVDIVEDNAFSTFGYPHNPKDVKFSDFT